DKIAAQIAEAQALRGAAVARLSAEQIDLVVDFADRSLALRQTGRTLALLRDELLPKARQSLEVARIEDLSGKLDFFNLSDAQRTLLGFELDQVEALTQRELTLTELSLLAMGVAPGSGRSRGSMGMGQTSASSINQPMSINATTGGMK